MPSQGWICYQRTKWDQSSEVSTADQSGSSIFRLLLLIFRLLSTFPALALSVRLTSNILQKRPTKLSESNNIPKTRKRLWRWRFNSIFVFPPRNALSYWSNAIHALPDPRRRRPPRERKKRMPLIEIRVDVKKGPHRSSVGSLKRHGHRVWLDKV